ncbi:hypothetical protein V1264_001902 [Littorina saxatilis]|uniref:Uncharacterized protein n=2 Tax=Littorina saxatilis TaxID=31220 RepID=A0AAN9C2V2_9CAEN
MATGGGGERGGKQTTGPVDISVNKVTCAVCLEKYRRPKLLPCFHTFCQSCLQAVAGVSPSFLCPACRAPVILPPRGVSALQSNFYVEADVHDEDSSKRRLCDVCAEDREATQTCLQCQQRYCLPCRRSHDSFTFGRGHSVVSLEPEGEEEGACGGAGSSPKRAGQQMRGREEWCAKHIDQKLLLHCKKCQANICMQCKLTLHEGHPTHDLVDEGARVKAKVQGMLSDLTSQMQQIDQMLLALENCNARISEQQEKTEQDFRYRADTLHQWVDQSLNEAVTSVQSAANRFMTAIQNDSEQMRNMKSAFQAQHDHLARTLRDGTDTDLVSLEQQLEASPREDLDLTDVRKDLKKSADTFVVNHDTTAINQPQLRAFLGVLESKSTKPDGHTSATEPSQGVGKVDAESVGATTASVPKTQQKESIYSKNTASKLIAICPISNNRVWVKYTPSDGSASQMKLFDEQGKVLCVVEQAVDGNVLMAVMGDVVLAQGKGSGNLDMVSSVGEKSTFHSNYHDCFLFANCASGFGYMQIPLAAELNMCRVTVHSVQPWKCDTEKVMNKIRVMGTMRDFSQGEKKIATTYDKAARVYCLESADNLPLFCKYTTDKAILDARFCKIIGEELLLVLVEDDKQVHVVDFTDGGRLVRYLDTGSMKLYRPCRLATDYDKRVWIGCHGGKVVAVDL